MKAYPLYNSLLLFVFMCAGYVILGQICLGHIMEQDLLRTWKPNQQAGPDQLISLYLFNL